MSISANQFFDLPTSDLFKKIFYSNESPVDWLSKIDSAISFLEKNNEPLLRADFPKGCVIDENVFIHKTVKLPPICVIQGPVYIGPYTEIRPFAYIRENVMIGKYCTVGNSTEIKNSILLDHVQVPHFNYIGDSILGNHSHLGAGVIIANLRLDQANIQLVIDGQKFDTGRRKFGAIIGDYAEVGCNSVLNPGCVISKNVKIGSNISLRGFVNSNILFCTVKK